MNHPERGSQAIGYLIIEINSSPMQLKLKPILFFALKKITSYFNLTSQLLLRFKRTRKYKIKNHNFWHYYFLTNSSFFIIAAIYHSFKFYSTQFNQRHLIFIFINLMLSYLLIKRPNIIFPLVITLMTIQQFYSHGTSFFITLNQKSFVNYLDLAVLFFIFQLFIFCFIFIKKEKMI